VRLAKLKGAQPQKIGVLSYYPNKGGGYTFFEGKEIVFYALPYSPSTSQDDFIVLLVNGKKTTGQLWESRRLSTIGTSKLSFGGQTVYRCEMKATHQHVPLREDIAIGKWSRDTPDGQFRLSIMEEDRETRLKLKSITPVLEHAEHGR
jgi:hypothetical protein